MAKGMMDRWKGVISVGTGKPVQPETVTPKKVQEIMALPDEELEGRRHMREVELDIRIAKSYSSKYENARKGDKSFSLTLGDWRALMTQTTCSYSGKRFVNGGHDYRTMERVNPMLGYTPENTIAVTHAANSEKSQLDAFMHGSEILDEVKVKLLRKAVYQIEKKLKIKKG